MPSLRPHLPLRPTPEEQAGLRTNGRLSRGALNPATAITTLLSRPVDRNGRHETMRVLMVFSQESISPLGSRSANRSGVMRSTARALSHFLALLRKRLRARSGY